MSYNEFPKVLHHPKYRPAVPYKQPRYRPGEEGYGKPVDPGATGRPAQFSDVTVHNRDQEMEYAAKGYVPAGQSDAEAYRRSMTGNEERPSNLIHDYPKMLYRKAEKVSKETGDLDTKIVKNADEEKSAVSEGWYVKPDDARAPKKKVAAAPAETESPAAPTVSPKKKGMTPEAKAAWKAKIAATQKRKAAEKKAAAQTQAA